MSIQNIRVKVSKKYSQIYRELTSDKLPVRSKVFEQHGDLFVLCCCLGYRAGKTKGLEKPEDLFWSHSLDAHQETILKSIAAINKNNETDLNILEKDNEVMSMAECYAENGMGILLNDVLNEYVKEEDGKYIIEYSDKSFLQKDILSYISLELNKTPFDL